MSKHQFVMTQSQARDVADEVDPPAERLQWARSVLAAGRRGGVNRAALQRLEEQMAARGVPFAAEPPAEQEAA